MNPYFGTAGNPQAFYDSGYKASIDMPRWLAEQGLTAYEYSVTRGVQLKEATARAIGEAAKKHHIAVSLHAPYYINLATESEETAANTQRHLLRSLEAAQWFQADRVVFHMGSPGKKERKQAMELAKTRFSAILEEAERLGLSGPALLPETMGKKNQLGTLAEVLELCRLGDHIFPTVDFGHLHAVTLGQYCSKAEFAAVFDRVGEALGQEAAQNLHIHFSKIEFTQAGEKRHWTFQDSFGPPHEPLLEVIAERGYTPRIICESAGTQAQDAKIMQKIYTQIVGPRV